MQILLNLFHENSSRLEDVRNDISSSLSNTDVAGVNDILENIASLNKSIKNSQILGNPALELQDQRNDLIDQLASYLPITVKYRDEEVGPGQFVEVLDVHFTASDGSKYTLISDSDFGHLDTGITDGLASLSITDASGNSFAGMEDLLGNGTLKGMFDILNKSGEFDKPASTIKGLGYYETSLNSLVKTFAEKFNEMNKAPDGTARPLFEKIDPNADWSAENIKIADGWANGSYGITASKNEVGGDIGSTANENIIAMIKALEDSQSFKGGEHDTEFFNGSFYDCFANIESTLAIDLKSTKTLLSNHISIVQQTANSRDGVSGVQLDEEGMNLMHYNQSYSAAARLMTTLDEALDTLINKTGVVGR